MKDIPEFHFIFLNAMKLKDPQDAYTYLWSQMCINDEKDRASNKKYKLPEYSYNVSYKKALQKLEERFNNNASSRKVRLSSLDTSISDVSIPLTVHYLNGR